MKTARVNQKLLVVQINLHHSKAATDDLLLLMMKENVDVALIQEPHIFNNKVQGLRLKHYNLFHSTKEGRIRACILARKSINMFLLPRYSNEDTTVVNVENREKSFLLTSAYMPYKEENPPPRTIHELVEFAQLEQISGDGMRRECAPCTMGQQGYQQKG